MIETTPSTVYSAECDVCKETFEHPYEGWSIFLDQDRMLDNMGDSGWHIDGINCYCPKCHEIDGDDNLIIHQP